MQQREHRVLGDQFGNEAASPPRRGTGGPYCELGRRAHACRPMPGREAISMSRTPCIDFASTLASDLPPEKWTPGYAYFASACCGVM